MRLPDLFVPGVNDLFMVDDPGETGETSRATSRRLPDDIATRRYRSLQRRRHDGPTADRSWLNAGDLHVIRITDRFGTVMEIGGNHLPPCWFSPTDAGAIDLRQGRHAVAAFGRHGPGHVEAAGDAGAQYRRQRQGDRGMVP